jgi:hypothetical protein
MAVRFEHSETIRDLPVKPDFRTIRFVAFAMTPEDLNHVLDAMHQAAARTPKLMPGLITAIQPTGSSGPETSGRPERRSPTVFATGLSRLRSARSQDRGVDLRWRRTAG